MPRLAEAVKPHSRHPAVWVVLCMVLAGCSTVSGPPMGGMAAFRNMSHRAAARQPAPGEARKSAPQARSIPMGRANPKALVSRATLGALGELDAFEAVLSLAGIDNEAALPPREAPLTPEDAAALYDVLLDKPVTLGSFGPRLVASYLLREAMEEEQEVLREVLVQRVERFKYLAVLRPDGYLAWALDGSTQQRVGLGGVEGRSVSRPCLRAGALLLRPHRGVLPGG